MPEDYSISDLLEKGAIIDNRRAFDTIKITLKDVLKKLAEHSSGFKTAVGYFYIEGLSEIIFSLEKLDEIKILMGGETSPKTKEELIRAFVQGVNQLEENEETTPAILLFHRLIKESKALQVRVFFGENSRSQRLHSKCYLLLSDITSQDILERYRAGIVGSSNLTPGGLIGNTELNVIIDRKLDLSYLEKWFDELWKEGSEEFENLRVSEILAEAIEKSKFGKNVEEAYKYFQPEKFFALLIKFLKVDFLFEDWRKSGLFKFQVVDAIRCLRVFNEDNYRGVFLTSSVGLGKSYVACKIAELFLREGKRVLIIAPANLVKNQDQWPRYLKEFNLQGKVDLISMGELQESPDGFLEKKVKNFSTESKLTFDSPNKYQLIIVDEAHNFRNEDAYRTRNLRKILDVNGESKIMFLTATPINTSLEDLLNLIKLFHRQGQNKHFDSQIRELTRVISLVTKKEYEALTEAEKDELADKQEEVERELFVKSSRETIKTDTEYIQELREFSGVDIREIPDPEIEEAAYELHRNYKPIVNNIVDFISSLSAAHLRIVDPERGKRLGGFFKWLLYKRFESSITAYYLTLKRLIKKNECILHAIDKRDPSCLDPENEDDIEINFGYDFKENIAEVIAKIEAGVGREHLDILEDLRTDTELMRKELNKLEPYAITNLCFENDFKLEALLDTIENHKGKKILIFTQYRDTLKAIKAFMENKIANDSAQYVSSEVDNKNGIIEAFNNSETKLRLLFSTDSLSEGFNFSGADVVVNFDIPYNPVRIIQRIGRATRLDKPKKIEVVNFKPHADIDRELDLVERMDLRIKDIIRFVGVEYRVWIDRENEIRNLISKRRAKDIKLYLEVLKSLRADLISSKFEKLEIDIKYSKPTLMVLQKAIKEYGLTRENVSGLSLPVGNYYTILRGEKKLVAYYKPNEIFNENNLKTSFERIEREINFEKEFRSELDALELFIKEQKKRRIVLSYYTDSIDRKLSGILDRIEQKKLYQLYPAMNDLIQELRLVKDSCGNTTGSIVDRINKGMKKDLSNYLILSWTKSLKDSFLRKGVQEKLVNEPKRTFVVAYLEDK